MRLPLHMPADPILKIPAADSLGQVESQFQINENSNCRGSTIIAVNLCRLRVARAIASKYATATVKIERIPATIHVTIPRNYGAYLTKACTACKKTSVWRSTWAVVVAGDIRAML
jgi:hypothetical protein